MEPRKTAIRDFWTDMMLVMKKVLSPSSEAVINEEEAMKEFQKVLATAYGVILQELCVKLSLLDWIKGKSGNGDDEAATAALWK